MKPILTSVFSGAPVPAAQAAERVPIGTIDMIDMADAPSREVFRKSRRLDSTAGASLGRMILESLMVLAPLLLVSK
jgi:hypothetical protein